MADDKKKLNPDAKEFSKKSEPFKWNPTAAPWQPTSFQAADKSAKPVILIVGPPGSGKGSVGTELAKQFNGKFWSAATSLRKSEQDDKKRAFNTPGRAGVLWHDTLDTLKDLDEMLAGSKADAAIKCYFLDAQGRNAQQFFYLCGVLRKHGLAPGQVLSLECSDDERLIKQIEAAAGGQWKGADDARRRIAQFRYQDMTRQQTLSQAKGLVQTVDATQSAADVIKQATEAVKMLMERPLGYSLPHNAESPCLTPVEDVYEYNYVTSWIQEKVSSGEARWPCSQASGRLEQVGDEILNTAAPKGSEDAKTGAATHMVSKKTDGTRYLLVYLPQYKDRSKGSFFLVPKHMEVIYTFRPRIGTLLSDEDAPREFAFTDYDVGQAPSYLNTTGNSGIFSFAVDGELVKLKSGWGGLQGMGCLQWKFIANDMLYFEPEKPREHLARNTQWTLDKRIQCMQRLGWPEADESACIPAANGITMCTRQYYPMDYVPSLLSSIEHQRDTYTTTGIVFTPLRKYMLWRDPLLCVWNHKDHNTTLLVAKKREGEEHVLSLHDRSGAEVGTAKVADAATVTLADGLVCQVRAVWEDKVGGAHTWTMVNPRSDLPMGADAAGVKAYLDPAGWLDGKEITKKLSKVRGGGKATMKRDPKDASPQRAGRAYGGYAR